MFRRYALRTTNPEAARKFYAEIAGLEFMATEGLELWPLPKQIQSKGAPSHWLGMIVVENIERTANELVERGGERLGPTTTFAAMKDPSGAVFAIRAGLKPPPRQPVSWHHLNAHDLTKAWQFYGDLLGWTRLTVDEDLHMFGLPGSAEAVGSMSYTGRQPGMHPHWLFSFPVEDAKAKQARIRELNGQTLATVKLPNGHRLTACVDPQGAMFGITG